MLGDLQMTCFSLIPPTPRRPPHPQPPVDHTHAPAAPALSSQAPTSRHRTEEGGVLSLLWFHGAGLCLTEAGEKNWAGFLLNSLGLLC